ncbi:MAG: DsbA family protein [Gammaproteobacteria bacterium]|nr:DsbA family protein [Gammaproteobacteria bacterium]
MKNWLFNQNPTLVYVHDPMCSWCWGFRPAWRALRSGLPDEITVVRLLGGLAPDSEVPMSGEMCGYLKSVWEKIEDCIPGTEFNYDFWTRCTPRRSTYPACRGVIAAREQGAEHDEGMTHAIQRAYYLQAENPSDHSTLTKLAGSLGLDSERFAAALGSEETSHTLIGEISRSRQIGIQGFPGLVFAADNRITPIRIDYHHPGRMLQEIRSRLKTRK